MARQRLVKPDLFQHEDLHRAELVSGLPLRLAFIGLWTQCDRRGCFVWKPGTLKLNVLPFDEVDFEAVLSALEGHGFVRSYVVAGKRYGQVPTLPIHQSFNVNEKPNPLIPEPPPNSASTVPEPSPHGASTPGTGTGTGTASSTGAASASARAHEDDGADPSLGASASSAAANDVSSYALAITVAANQAIGARFGEQPNPLRAAAGKTHHLASDLLATGIPAEFAARSVARQVAILDTPCRSMAYFRAGIVDDWAAHNERVAAAGAAPVQPLEPLNRRQRSAVDIVREQHARQAGGTS